MFSSALEVDPQHAESVYNEALWKWKKGNVSDEEMLLRVSQIIPNNQYASYYLGLCHMARGDLTIAIQTFENFLVHYPNHGSALKHIALGQLALGKNAEAVKSFRKALELLPDDPDCIEFVTFIDNLAIENKEKTIPFKLDYSLITADILPKESQIIGVDTKSENAFVILDNNSIEEINLLKKETKNKVPFIIPDTDKKTKRFEYLSNGKYLLIFKTPSNTIYGELWDIRSHKLVATYPLPKNSFYSDETFVLQDDILFVLSEFDRSTKSIYRCVAGNNEPEPWLTGMFSTTSFVLDLHNDLIVTTNNNQIDIWGANGGSSRYAIKIGDFALTHFRTTVE